MAGILSEWCISLRRRLRFFLWQMIHSRPKVSRMAAIAHIHDMRNFSRGGSSGLPEKGQKTIDKSTKLFIIKREHSFGFL